MLIYLSFFACNQDNKINDQNIASAEEIISYRLDLESPEYGAFYGEGPIPVSGVISPPTAELVIEGAIVNVDPLGRFSYEVPFEDPSKRSYRVVDVELREGELKERVPVFAGKDPKETWPGGLSARLLPEGLRILGESLGGLIDESGWSDSISSQLPVADLTWFILNPVGVVHDPTVVALNGAEEGVAVDFSLRGVGIEYEISWTDFDGVAQTEPLFMVFDEIAIGATAVPEIDENGILIFTLVEADLTMDSPDFQFGVLEGWVAEWITDQMWTWILEPVMENILDTILAEVGSLEIGGPFAFETDLMGAPLGLSLYDVYGDPDGLALGLELQVGELQEQGAQGLKIPTETEAPDAQLAIGLHEGLLQELLAGQLLSMLSQDLDLGGAFGSIIGNGVLALPGGDDAPDGDGWCLSIAPGSASVVRLQEGIAPLAYLYLPDLNVNVGIKDGSDCEDWLVASLATEIALEVSDGSVLGIDIEMPEGSLLYYGADADEYEEEEVIAAFSSYLETMLGLVGGFAEIDLGEMLAGSEEGEGMGLGNVSLNVVDSRSLWYDNPDIEGLYALSINLWTE
ncbi:MAG: hypothetical protein VX278_15815 [Myxococcota bacterium]|nr:hypothetical protein [Myxococcota bacterium]